MKSILSTTHPHSPLQPLPSPKPRVSTRVLRDPSIIKSYHADGNTNCEFCFIGPLTFQFRLNSTTSVKGSNNGLSDDGMAHITHPVLRSGFGC